MSDDRTREARAEILTAICVALPLVCGFAGALAGSSFGFDPHTGWVDGILLGFVPGGIGFVCSKW